MIRKSEHANTALGEKDIESPLIQLNENMKTVILPLKEIKPILGKRIEDIDKGIDLITKVDTREYESLLDLESKIGEAISEQIGNFGKDESRKALVDDFQRANKVNDSFWKWNKSNKKIGGVAEIKSDYDDIKNDYIEKTKESIKASFKAISSDVSTYFKILEPNTDVLDEPKIKIDSGKNKAVELEVKFGGDPISPAYKYLSESQLNSFGLSIFLASVKHFNHDFKFIILDDIINSFDTYKRPRVIDLLSKHFAEYPILLLTHDSIWLDRLQKSFP